MSSYHKGASSDSGTDSGSEGGMGSGSGSGDNDDDGDRVENDYTEADDEDAADDDDEHSADDGYRNRTPDTFEKRRRPVHNTDTPRSSDTPYRPPLSEQEILRRKRELLYQFERLERKGFQLPQKFTMANSLESLQQEFERIRRDRELDASVRLQRRFLMALVSGIEFLNTKGYDPFDLKLGGWSESVHDSIEDYDDVFAELHAKYAGTTRMPPELKLLFMLASSMFMYHLTQTLFKSTLPGIDTVLKQNPDLMQHMMSAAANTMAQSGQDQTGLASMFNRMFSAKSQPPPQGSPAMATPISVSVPLPPPRSMPSSQPQTAMRPPSNVQDLLAQLGSMAGAAPAVSRSDRGDDGDRIDMFSDTSSSSAGSSGGRMQARRSPRTGKITLSL